MMIRLRLMRRGMIMIIIMIRLRVMRRRMIMIMIMMMMIAGCQR